MTTVISGQGMVVRIAVTEQVVRIVSGGPRGAPGSVGPAGPQGPAGPSGTGTGSAVWEQNVPSDMWVVTHSLPYHPSVTVLDSSDRLVEGDVQYGAVGQLTVSFVAAFSGKVLMS